MKKESVAITIPKEPNINGNSKTVFVKGDYNWDFPKEPKESEDELWNEVFKLIGAYLPAFENEISQLKKSFSITRK